MYRRTGVDICRGMEKPKHLRRPGPVALAVQTIEQVLSEAKPEDHPKVIALRIVRALMQAGLAIYWQGL